MRILLINLPSEGESFENTTPDYLLYDFFRFPPLGLMAIATEVPKHHDLQILDVSALGLSIGEAMENITQFRPDVLGISVVTRRYYSFCEIIKKSRKAFPQMRIVVGGPHINYFPRETMFQPALDYALPGFGEKRFPALIEAIEEGEKLGDLLSIPGLLFRNQEKVRETPAQSEPLNLDYLPFPDRSLVDLNLYLTVTSRKKMTTMYSSRGCPFHCIFCDVQEKRFHFRSAQKIVDEFEYLISLGIEEIHIFDDTFNLNRTRVIEMCLEMKRRRIKVSWSARVRAFPFDFEMLSLMKEVGCERLHVGVESFDDDILEYCRKGVTVSQIKTLFSLCNTLKIETLAYFILGFPGESDEYRRGLFRKIKKLNPTYVYVNILYPLPKTQFYQTLLEEGVFKRDEWMAFVASPSPEFTLPQWREAGLQKELFLIADSIHRQYFFSLKFIFQDIRRTASVKMFLFKAKVAILMFFKIILRQIRL